MIEVSESELSALVENEMIANRFDVSTQAAASPQTTATNFQLSMQAAAGMHHAGSLACSC
jgi:hypothetical protein